MSKAYSSNYDLIDWSDFKPATPVRVIKKADGAPTFVPDIQPFLSPMRTVISSRSQLREYEQRHGVRQVGTDLKVSDYAAKPEPKTNERALERAYQIALQKAGLG